jgi:hypothetical protein
MENLIVLLLIGVGLAIRLIVQSAQAAAKKSEGNPLSPAPGPSNAPIPRSNTPVAPDNAETERIRKFLEALGQPASATPPPKVAPRTAPAVRKQIPPVPPLVAGNVRPNVPVPPPPRVPTMRPPPRSVSPPVVASRAATAARSTAADEGAAFSVRDVQMSDAAYEERRGVAPANAPVEGSTLRQLLRSRDGLRHAVILREVFGPPRSLQALDEGKMV